MKQSADNASAQPIIKYSPGLLVPGHETYTTGFLRQMFDGKKVSHILPYHAPQKSEEDRELFMDNRKHLSISGVQEKVSLLLVKNKLRLTKEGEQGGYILKPIPRDLRKVDQVPANEHLTMQIAQQVYGIPTAPNGMIFFKDGSPAYITRRFDVRPDGGKWGKEDFATLARKSLQTGGVNFKYDYSYEEAGALIKKFVPAWKVEMEKFFSLVIYNYLFSNGDAHLKNFALLETTSGDHLLSPAYDLVNTRIHVSDTDFALKKGLFKDDFRSVAYKRNAHPGLEDFIELGKRLEMDAFRIGKILAPFLERQDSVYELIKCSFLDESTKTAYTTSYNTKRNFLTKT